MTWVLTIASLVGVIANIYHKRWCFWIWFFTNATWAFVDFTKGIPAQGTLFIIYTILAVWGLCQWKKEGR